MPSPIDFYYEFSSPYGYFASVKIEELAQELGRTINWHPILLGPMFKATGSAPMATVPLKAEYMLHDFKRTASLFNIPYKQPLDFPIGTVAAARSAIYLRQKSMELAAEFSKRIYAEYFAKGNDIRDIAVINKVASDIGVNPEDLNQAIQDQAIKDELKAEVDKAMSKNVFGSPFIIIDNESYWGFDRFDHIRLMHKV